MTGEVSANFMRAGERYVLFNGSITEPVRIVRIKTGEVWAAANLTGHGPWSEMNWDLNGVRRRKPSDLGWSVRCLFDAKNRPATLKEGLRYYYVSGGITEPLVYRPECKTFCMWLEGHQWDEYGKNLDFNGTPDPNRDLVVELPLVLKVGDDSEQSL